MPGLEAAKSEIDGVSQIGREEKRFVFDRLPGFQVGEMPGEARPCVNLQQQFRDFDVRQQSRRPVYQLLGGGRNGRVQRSHFESGLRDQIPPEPPPPHFSASNPVPENAGDRAAPQNRSGWRLPAADESGPNRFR